jgi:hypothetical protein
MMTIIARVAPVTAYKRTTRATERYMEERLWQRALRLSDEERAAHLPKKKRTFAEVLRAVRGKLGRHVDIYV